MAGNGDSRDGGPNDVHLIRQALQGTMRPALVSTVLFEALGASPEGPPQGSKALLAFLRGPLRATLERHAETGRAAALVERIEESLREAGAIEQTGGISREPTAAVPTDPDAVKVLVVASGGDFARRMELALGRERVEAGSTDALHGVITAASVETPAILIVDSSDFPRFPPERLAETLPHFPPTTAHVVWGAELPYGRRIMQLCEGRNIAIAGVAQAEGMAPLLDLVRARRRQ